MDERQTGRSTKTITEALALAKKWPLVVVLVPTHKHGQVLAAMACDQLAREGWPREDSERRLRRLRFASSDVGLRGTGLDVPVLADHSWHERYAWVLEAARKVKETGARA